MTDHSRSSADLEREVEAQRAGIARTLDEISTRLTPGQILDEAWEFARGTDGGAFVRNLGASARDNPLPIGLITAGIAWLVSGRGGGRPRISRDRREDRFRTDAFESGYPLADLDVDAVGRNGGALPRETEGGGMLDGAAQSVASGVAAAREGIAHAGGIVGDASRIAADDALDSADRLRRSALERGRRLGMRSRDLGRQVQARAGSVADEQPVLLAVAGLAIGALVGALARGTATESRLVGEASDRVKDRAMDLAARGLEQGTQAVERTYDAVREEADKQGLTTENAGAAASEIGEKAAKVAKKGRARLEEELGASPAGDASRRG
jgi:hypothetical protein